MVANSKKKQRNKIKQIDLTEFQKIMEDYFVANIKNPLPTFGTTYGPPPKLNPYLRFGRMYNFEPEPFIANETIYNEVIKIVEEMQEENKNPNKN